MKDPIGCMHIYKGMFDRDALRWRNASKSHKLHHESSPLGSDLSRRLQFWMRPAVAVVCINSLYNNAHGYCNPWHDPTMRTAPIKIGRQLQNKAQRATGNTNASPNGSYRQKTSTYSAEGSSWKPRQPVLPSEDRAQRISGSQWARPERLPAWRSEGSPLLPVTSSDCCLQLTTQCWKLCCENSHIPLQICVVQALIFLRSTGVGAGPTRLSSCSRESRLEEQNRIT